jgi:hypothetical protein
MCRWYGLIARMISNPTLTFVAAYSNSKYNNFLGDPTNFDQVGTFSATYYNTTGATKWAWLSASNATAYTGELEDMCCAGAPLLGGHCWGATAGGPLLGGLQR